MPIDLIDKIQPKNNAFTGLVDAAQVIGLSAYMSSGSSLNISGIPGTIVQFISTSAIGSSILKSNQYGISIGPNEASDGNQVSIETSSVNGTGISISNPSSSAYAGFGVISDPSQLSFYSVGSLYQDDIVPNIPYANKNIFLCVGELNILHFADSSNLFINTVDYSDINIFRNEINADYQVDNDATLYINRRGFQNGNSFYRSTIIQDGKLGTIATFDATNHNISATGNIKASTFTTDGINTWNLGAYTSGTSIPTGKIKVQISGKSYEIQVKAL